MKESGKKELPSLNLEEMLTNQGYGAICGVDEAGRGPLAGPVVAAALILPPDVKIVGCTDSKKLTAEAREEVFDEIVELGLICAVGVVDSQSIDQMNILRASLMAMRKAVMELSRTPDVILVDGNYPIPRIPQPQYAIIGGDARCQSIAAASIIAKVTRDRIMDKYDQLYPHFSFGKHRGYPTPDHLEELKKHGPCDIHRKSFKPVADLLESYVLFE